MMKTAPRVGLFLPAQSFMMLRAVWRARCALWARFSQPAVRCPEFDNGLRHINVAMSIHD